MLHPERMWLMPRAEAVESSRSKLSLKRPNEAHGLAGSQRLRQLPGGLARRLIAWCRRARCWRVLARSCGYSSEKRAARFFKRIFRHSIGLFHLGLLISSSFVSLSASSPTTQLFLNRGRGGWHAVPGPKCFLFRPAAFRYTLLHGSGGYPHRGLTAKSALFFNVLRASDLLLFFATIAVRLVRAVRVRIVQFSDRTFHVPAEDRYPHIQLDLGTEGATRSGNRFPHQY